MTAARTATATPGVVSQELAGAFALVPLVTVVRHANPESARMIALASYTGGIRVLEVTATVPGAASVIHGLRRELPSDAVIGAGTVLNPACAEELHAAGATFVVSPGYVPDVVATARELGADVIPGVMTPSEAGAAVREGCNVLKLFPADTVGPSHLRALAAVHLGVRFVPTGGIGPDEVRNWLQAGALAVGVGSCLNAALRSGGPTAVTELSTRLIATAKNTKVRGTRTTKP